MDRYELVKNIGTGNFGVARLMRDRITNDLVAIKCIERGARIDQNVQREIINHRSLRHPNIVRFKEVCLTDTHLAIVMEYAAGGELFERISTVGRFKEDEARFFFQQLISGVSYCHAMQICHRDLKLENTLLDGSDPPQLKICDFGYSKSAVLHSAPKSTVGTPAYIAPEVLKGKRYDGKMADVWSCGVTLYVMLVGAYPFEDADDPKNFRKAIGRILKAQYTIPSFVEISPECSHLLSLVLVANPSKRITIPEIMCHQWFTKDLRRDLALGSDPSYDHDGKEQPVQSEEEVLRILNEARMMPGGSHSPLELMKINNAGEEEDKYDDDDDDDDDADAAADAAADDDDADEVDDADDADDDDEEKDPIPDMIHESDSELEIEAEVEYFDVEECPEFDDPPPMSGHGNSQNGQFHISFSKYFQYYLLVFRWGRNAIWNLSKFL